MSAGRKQLVPHCQRRPSCRKLIRDIVCAFGNPRPSGASLRPSPFSRPFRFCSTAALMSATGISLHAQAMSRLEFYEPLVPRVQRSARKAELHSICT